MGLALLATSIVSAADEEGVHPLRTHSIYMPYIGKTRSICFTGSFRLQTGCCWRQEEGKGERENPPFVVSLARGRDMCVLLRSERTESSPCWTVLQ